MVMLFTRLPSTNCDINDTLFLYICSVSRVYRDHIHIMYVTCLSCVLHVYNVYHMRFMCIVCVSHVCHVFHTMCITFITCLSCVLHTKFCVMFPEAGKTQQP